MVLLSKRNLSRSVSVVVLLSVLTFGLSLAVSHHHQPRSGGTQVLTDSASALSVGGSENDNCQTGFVLIAIGMSGILGTDASIAIMSAGLLLLLTGCLY